MTTIIDVHGRQVLDSRGNPTVEGEVHLEAGAGGGGAENKGKLGANAILGVSLAVARAAAEGCGLPLYRYLGGVGARTLPVPMMNILNGGSPAHNNVDIQEFMVMPVGAKSFSEALRMGVETFHHLKKVLKGKGLNTNVGDEGGFAPLLRSNAEAIEVILEAIGKAGYRPGKEIGIALDAAASEFREKVKYVFRKSDGSKRSADGMVKFYEGLCRQYPIVSVEDGFAEDDWRGWKMFTQAMGKKIQIVGDDVFVTNPKILRKGIDEGIANSVLIKLNQIGTVSETIDAVEMAKRDGGAAGVSPRAGETRCSTNAA